MALNTANPSRQGMDDFIKFRDSFGKLVPELGQLDVADITDRNALVVMARLIMNPTTESPRSVEFPNEYGTLDRITWHEPRGRKRLRRGLRVYDRP